MEVKSFLLNMPEPVHSELKELVAILKTNMTQVLLVKVEELLVELRLAAKREKARLTKEL